MKPTLQFHSPKTRHDSETLSRAGVASPKIDYGYLPNGGRDFSGGRGERRPSFRAISREYFDGDARQTFAREAFLFACITLMAAVPVIQSARGLFNFVQATGLL